MQSHTRCIWLIFLHTVCYQISPQIALPEMAILTGVWYLEKLCQSDINFHHPTMCQNQHIGTLYSICASGWENNPSWQLTYVAPWFYKCVLINIKTKVHFLLWRPSPCDKNKIKDKALHLTNHVKIGFVTIYELFVSLVDFFKSGN